MLKKIIFITVACAVALPISVVLHEVSHLLLLYICGGTCTGGSLGAENFISGYVEQQYIPIIALSSTFIPLIISIILSFFKGFYLKMFCTALTIPTLVNTIINAVYHFTIPESERAFYDTLLAMDTSTVPNVIYGVNIALGLITLIVIIINLKYIIKNLSEEIL